MGRTEFDECQLKIRGEVFFQGFICLLVYMFFDAVIKEYVYLWASPTTSMLIGILLCVCIISVRLILKDSYGGQTGNYKLAALVMSICAVTLFILFAIDLAKGAPILQEGMVSTHLRSLITGIFIGIISATYWIRSYKNKKEERIDE